MMTRVLDIFLELIGWILKGFGFPEFQNYLDCKFITFDNGLYWNI